MPGPGQKKRSKQKRPAVANTSGGPGSPSSAGTFVPPDDFLTSVKDAEGWAEIAGLICTVIKLPGKSCTTVTTKDLCFPADRCDHHW